MRYRHRTSRAVLSATLLCAACSDPSGPSLQEVGSIAVTAPWTELTVGSSVQLQATILNGTGAVVSGGHVTWTSSNQVVATVSTSGLVSAQSAGTTTVTGRSGDKSDDVVIRVIPPACTPAAAGTIAIGQTRAGTLGPTDCLGPHGGAAHGWRLDLTAAATVQIDLSSSDFEPLILITDLQMTVWDVAYGVQSARLIRMLEAGTYIVWAAAANVEPGSFQLSVAQGPPPCTAGDAGSIEPGQSITGSLGPSDCLFASFATAQGWRFDLDATTRIRTDLISSHFDALLVVTDLSLNVLAWDDDGGGALNARLLATLPAGSFIVWAMALNGGTGPFQLSMGIAEPYSCPHSADSISVGQTRTGALAATDCILENGRFGDAWTLALADPGTVRIDLTSNQFDTFLILADSAGLEIAFDDDGGQGFNSQLAVALPAGQYTIWATSFAVGATGTYQLAIQASSAGSTTAGLLAGDGAKALQSFHELGLSAKAGAASVLPPELRPGRVLRERASPGR